MQNILSMRCASHNVTVQITSREKFELHSKLFDHAAHNGSNYLNGHCMVSILLSFPVLADGSIRYLSVPLGYQLWDKNRQNWKLPLKWYAMPWTVSARPDRCSCSATAAIQRDALRALWMNTITLISSAMPGLILSCMTSRLNGQGKAAAQGNMANVRHQKISGLNPQKPGTGRSACAWCLPGCGESGSCMALSRSQKAGTAAAGFSSVPKIQKASFLITAGVKMKQYVAMGKKMHSSSQSPVIRRAGISKYPAMKAKLSGHLKNTVCGAVRALSVW